MSRPRLSRTAARAFGRALPFAALAALATLGGASLSSADDTPTPVAPAIPREAGSSSISTNASLPRGFESPEAAAKVLFEALGKNDDATLKTLIGPGNDDLVQDGTDPVVRAERAELARAAEAKLTFEKRDDGRVTLVVGKLDYPLAIPLVSKDGVWRADAATGRKELLARRVGENELEAIGICLAYADAQVAYASKDRNDDDVKEYAQRLVSTAGTHDGLTWDSEADDDRSPAAPGLTPLKEALTSDSLPRSPFGGYYWRILTAQGPNAPGGAYSYVINGRMIAGFALLAVPAVHRNTGVMSFIVSNQGKVYEKDLGADTLKVAATIDTFEPDATWRVVDDGTLRAAAATSPEDAPFVEKGEPSVDAVPTSGATPVDAASDEPKVDDKAKPADEAKPSDTPKRAGSQPPCVPKSR